MSKKENKINIEVPKMILKKAIQNHKKFALQGKNTESSPLSAIQFEIEKDFLILRTTDGNRALISNIEILASDCGFEEQKFLLSMEQVSKVVLKKDNLLNTIAIIKKGDFVEFYDLAYESTQKLKTRKDDFLNIEGVVPVDNSFKVCIAPYQIKALSSIKSDEGLKIFFNEKDASKAILVESQSETLKQTAIIQPLTPTHAEKI